MRGSSIGGILLVVAVCLQAQVDRASAQEPGLAREAGSSGVPAAEPVSDGALYVVTKLDRPIVLSGRVDDPAWDSIEPLPAVMHDPDFGSEPSERTEFRIAHDGRHLYFSCRAFDSNPDGIQAPSLRRNDPSFLSDSCAIRLDTFNDEENALGFHTTPAGVRSDMAYRNDGGASNADWDTFWDVAVSQNERGWYAEFRIPFSSLHFQAEGGRVTMGVSMIRNIAQRNERVIHPAIPPTWGVLSYAKASQMRKIVLENVERSDPIYFTPYSLAGGGYTHDLNDLGTAYDRRSSQVREAGFDLKYGLTSNLTMNLTVNTDFAQVEADDQQVNLTRFSLFFPEKRRFFQDQSAIFDYALGGQDLLFHSRNMGLANAEPVRIYGGARVVGRIGEWDVGFLDLQTADSDLLPGENQGVLRLRRRVLNPNSYVGAILTSRLSSGGRYNLAYGLDGIARVVDQEYLTLKWAQSFSDEEVGAGGGGPGLTERSMVRVNWERRGVDFLSYFIDMKWAGNAFDPGMGFLRRRDFTNVAAGVGYGWRLGPESRILRYTVDTNGSVFRKNDTGSVETVDAQLRWSMQLRSGKSFSVTVPFQYDNVTQPFSLPENSSVPAAIYKFASVSLQFTPSQTSTFRPALSAKIGRYYDGTQVSVSFTPTWNVSRHLSLNGSYGLDRVEFPDRNQAFTAHVMRLRGEVMFSTRAFATAFIQYNSTQDSAIANLRFHYNPREGNDFYIVWNEGLVTDRLSRDPAPPTSRERTLMVKYAHTVDLRGLGR